MLERCLQRLEWDRVKEREAKAAADQFEAERMAMQSIDWCVPLPSHGHTLQPAARSSADGTARPQGLRLQLLLCWCITASFNRATSDRSARAPTAAALDIDPHFQCTATTG